MRTTRRGILGVVSGAVVASSWPSAIERALAIAPIAKSKTIQDVQHVVILMMENRSFDHYFGSLRGVRGFKDRHPVPVAGGKAVWQQSDGVKELSPFHLDSTGTSALKVASTPHAFSNTQAAWGQGQLRQWPRFKGPLSMGHYRRQDIPFQFALADAFTICDSYHCSVATGTDPNRITFWSGSVYDPQKRLNGENCTDADSEPDNLRCWIKGALPEPGYTYQGSDFTWQTIPEVLEAAGISWKIYQDPNDNWTGAMHGCLAFGSFRHARPGSALYEKGMRHWSLDQFAQDVKSHKLPEVTWLLPAREWSEHPSGSSPVQGAEYVSRVLDALTAEPEVWGRTAFFVCFDENDGFFDHVPAPAPPSYYADGTVAGASTISVTGEYFLDPDGKYRHPDDPYHETVRPWGLGPRVPMYVISPWSRGGWVNSQVFDHTSVGQFIERRFGVTVPAISPWHRAISGDLTSCFDFTAGARSTVPQLPHMRNSAALVKDAEKKPAPVAPSAPQPLFQEPGTRPSRALPYALEVDAVRAQSQLTLRFRNLGSKGAVFHVYDRQDLESIPRRFTVEAGKSLIDRQSVSNEHGCNLWVYGPNGFVREFVEMPGDTNGTSIMALMHVDIPRRTIILKLSNISSIPQRWAIAPNAYEMSVATAGELKADQSVELPIQLGQHNWYDFSLTTDYFARRFSGRIETGKHDVSDPAIT